MEEVPISGRGTSGIYRITHVPSSRSYVGQSIDIESRWYIHLWQLGRDEHHSAYLQRVWNKYGGDSFEHVLLETCDIEGLGPDEARAVLNEREQFWMDELGPVFNSCPVAGSPLGRKHTPESRAKMSQKQKGKPKPLGFGEKIRAALKGVPKSPEHCASIGKASKGRYCSPETREKIRVTSTGRKHTLETRAKMSIAIRAALAERKERLAKEAADAAEENE